MAHFGLQKLSNNGAIFVAPDGLNAGWGGDNLPFVDDMVKLIDMATPMRDKFAENNGRTLPASDPPRPNAVSDAHIGSRSR